MNEWAGGAIRAQRGRIAQLTIERPEAKNALNTASLDGLIEAIRDLGQDPGCRVIVLSGAGGEAFCAGADLKEVAAAETVSQRRAYFAGVAHVLGAMADCPLPIIASIRGYALAGGMGLVVGADHAICADDAVLALPEAGIGLFPMVVMAPILRAAGRRAAWELLTTGRRINGPEAAALGLVTRSVPESELDEAVDHLAERLCRQSPEALAAGKHAMHAVDGLGYRESLNVLSDLSALLAGSDDAKEGISAFFERRKPQWQGR